MVAQLCRCTGRGPRHGSPECVTLSRAGLAGERWAVRRLIMTREQAIAVAEQHLRSRPFPEPEYSWVVTDPKQVHRGWLFPYQFERIAGEGELPLYAGAIGFLIRPDASVEDLSYTLWFENGGD